MGLGSFLGSAGGFLLGGPAGSWLGNQLGGAYDAHKAYGDYQSTNNQNRKMQYEFAKHGLGWRIEDAKKYGIHPLAAIGAAPGPMPTVAMQNPSMANMSSGFTPPPVTDPTDNLVKNLTIQNLQNTLKLQESQLKEIAQSDQLLIPVQHKDYPGKKVWIWNPRFHVYGTIPTVVTAHGNQDEILKLMRDEAPSSKHKSLMDRIIDGALKHFPFQQR
jgi:hypothetical protein